MILSVPTSTVQDLATATSSTYSQLAILVVLMISVPLSFYILRRIMALFPKPRSR